VQVATNNLEWYMYGAWDSYDGFIDHFYSKHIRKLQDWAADHNLVWKMSHLRLHA
jgi:quinol monooxygenase YgiN